MKPIQSILFALILSWVIASCTNKPTKEENQHRFIIGDWKLSFSIDSNKKITSIEFNNQMRGYSFYENDTIEVKDGFWKEIDTATGWSSHYQYFGKYTVYKLHNDTLSYYDFAKKLWRKVKILKLTNDSLNIYQLTNDGWVTLGLIKQHYTLDTLVTFDNILVYTSGCLGSCENTTTMIDASGNVTFLGGYYTSRKGYHTAKISKKEYETIANDYRKIDLKNAKSEYVFPATDQQEVDLSLIKDGRVCKTIRDYGCVAPIELIWANNSVSSLYKLLNLHKLSSAEDPSYLIPSDEVHLITDDSTCRLSTSQIFLFWNYLRLAKQTNKALTKLYELDFWNSSEGDSDLNKVETDGELYKFTFKKKDSITLDIGFNFIETNRNQFKFTNKTKEYLERQSDYYRWLKHSLRVTPPKVK